MNIALLKKRYNIYIISFILLSAFFGHDSFATPKCPIITNQFQGANGVTIDTGPTGWSVDSSLLLKPHPTGFFFAINSNRFTATNLGGIGIVTSHVFSIAGYKAPQVSVKITSESVPDTTQYIQFYYKLDGGAPVLVATQKGNFGSLTFTSPVLNGSTVQLIIKLYDFSTTSTKSNYYIERFDVFQTAGPCTPGNASITVTPSATTSGVLTCTNPSTTLSATSSTTGLAYFWTGPGISNTNTNATVNVSVAGTYTLVVTTGTPPATTLWGTNTITITANKTPPALVAAANTGPLTCGRTSVTLTGTSSTSGVTFSWTGPGITGTSAGATAAVTVPGTYTVTATDPTNGCTATAATTVAQTTTAPALLAIGSSPSNTQLTCSVPSVSLTATSSTSGTTFIWKEPNGTTPTGATIAASDSGSYIVTATNPVTGCTAKDTVQVTKNIAAPAAPVITSSPSNVLTCTTTSVSLTGSSTTSGATYSWTGPGITGTSAGATVAVTVPGTYTVTATNPTTGCTATTSTTVTQSTTLPAGVTITSSPSNVLTCTTASVSLTGTSTATGLTFTWTGPGITGTSTGATVAVTVPGTYIVTATDPTTGCTATASTTVTQTTAAPAGVAITTANNSTQLTCSTSSITLTGSSTSSGVSYNWTGPNNYSVAAPVTTVFNPGVYTLTVTNTTTGCSSTATITITQNVTPPANVAINPNVATLTCSNPSAILTGSSSTTGATYNWSGPNSFTASGITTTVAEQGEYVLTVTDPTNGCTSTISATVSQNFNPPANVTAINSGPLTCSNTMVTLTGSSFTSGVTFNWTGPNNFTSSSATPTTTVPGTYTLVVTNPVNGCTATATTVVSQNNTAPGSLLINSIPTAPILTCTNTSVSLTASSDAAGATYNWTGPNGFATSAASISVTTPGVYSVTALNTANGCSSSINTNVSQNIAVPAGLAATSLPIDATLTCSVTGIALTATSAVTGASYTWTGPNSFTGSTAAITATSPGTFTVTATDPSNGCSSTTSAIITQNITAPVGLKSTPNPTNSLITCTHPNVVLTASATTTTVLYSWTGPNSFTATGSVATITAPGSYRLTATDTTNGCTSFVTAPVSRNITPPNGVTTSTSDVLTCLITDVFVKGTSNTTGALFSWTGPGGFTASTAIAHTSTPGTYNLTVTNPVNGCTATANTIVASNTAAPSGVAATNTGPLNCVNTSVNVIGSSATTGVSYNWAAPDNSLLQGATVSVTLAGTYTLVVTDSTNGCTATATTTVTQNTTGCTGSSVQPNGSSTSSKLLTPQGADSTQGTTGFEYKVYPNPFSGRAYIEFKSPASSLVTMEIYSNTGVLKKVLFNSTVIANQSYKLELNKGSLSSGVYFCIIRSNGKVYSTKLILIDP